MPDRDEFYVNYLPMPGGLKRFCRRVAVGLVVAVAGVAAVAAAFQRSSPTGVFEFGVQRPFEGVLYETPLPVLRVLEDGGFQNFLLVGFGKSGLPRFARGHHGEKVRFSGSLVYRESMTIVEMNDPASFQVVGTPSVQERRSEVESVGPVTVTGELVDTKCYFGVMKPATGKVHRACAIRCLSGGVPPGLLVRDRGDDGIVFMLAGPSGQALVYDVEWAARTVRASGVLELHAALPVIRVSSLSLESGGGSSTSLEEPER